MELEKVQKIVKNRRLLAQKCVTFSSNNNQIKLHLEKQKENAQLFSKIQE
jgi:hypothetical protein